MPSDRTKLQVDTVLLKGGYAPQSRGEDDDDGLGWWLSGGAFLVAWTGLALLLTLG